MSKIVKLSRLAVVLSTLFVLGSMTALPVAYANGGKPDTLRYCNNRDYDGAVSTESDGSFQCADSGPIVSESFDGPSFTLNDVCKEQYPGTSYDLASNSCK
jgi:hypothetical protein